MKKLLLLSLISLLSIPTMEAAGRRFAAQRHLNSDYAVFSDSESDDDSNFDFKDDNDLHSSITYTLDLKGKPVTEAWKLIQSSMDAEKNITSQVGGKRFRAFANLGLIYLTPNLAMSASEETFSVIDPNTKKVAQEYNSVKDLQKDYKFNPKTGDIEPAIHSPEKPGH